MSNKQIHVVQPYDVGPKSRPCKAIIIPSKLVKDFSIDKNTIFVIKPDKNYDKLILEKIFHGNVVENKNVDLIPVEKSLITANQQESNQDH